MICTCVILYTLDFRLLRQNRCHDNYYVQFTLPRQTRPKIVEFRRVGDVN